MYKVNDYLVYGKDVCKVCEIEEKKFNDEDYYLLRPLKDSSLKIEVPVSNKANKIRSLITKEELEKIIKEIPDIPLIESDEKFIEAEYKSLLSNPSHKNLIRIIKTTYLRNKKRLDNNKKTTDKDTKYFELAEEYLYNEFSVVLGYDYEQTKNYIITQVNKLEKI